MDLSQALATFLDESRDLLAQMEEILLRAETTDLAPEDMHALFRCAHTIKGSAGLFGLDVVVRFTHGVENVLDRLRNGEIVFTDALINLLLESQDHIARLVHAVAASDALPEDEGGPLLERLQAFNNDFDGRAGDLVKACEAERVEVDVAREALIYSEPVK